jgi:hypothetical protein
MLRISFQIDLKQCIIIKFLRFKWIKLLDIHHELTLSFNREAYTLASIKHWIHELKTGRTILTDEFWSGRLSIDHIDVLILKKLTKISFAPVQSLSNNLRILKTTIWCRLTNSLQFKCRHFKWVTHILMQEFRQKYVEGSRVLLETLEA